MGCGKQTRELPEEKSSNERQDGSVFSWTEKGYQSSE